ncbi:MAG: hypothetical protein LUO93_02350 [Methanomicrobiales archaeon]|nr:hypothetical protein [Methanomicrobiales archaeon]
MKFAKVIAIAMILAMALLVSSVAAGNGIDLNGQHFNLNLVGISKSDRNMPDDLDTGHTIFVKYNKTGGVTTRIYLKQGADFQVLDKDGTDGKARFQLPNPYPDYNSTTGELGDPAYMIYIRVLGKPGGSGSITTGLCNVTDPAATECVIDISGVWLSADTVTLTPHANDNKFEEVTDKLTTVNLSQFSICGDGNDPCGIVPIFDLNPFDLTSPEYYLYFWEMYNNGIKLVQLRFYPL